MMKTKSLFNIILCSLMLCSCGESSDSGLIFHPSNSNESSNVINNGSISINLISNKQDEGCIASAKLQGNFINLNVAPANGYRFLGWSVYENFSSYFSTVSKGQESIDRFNDFIIDDVLTIYANFEKLYTIHYDLNGGSSDFDATESFSAEVNSYTIDKIPTRENATFCGWEYRNDGKFITEIPSNTLSDVYLKAIWDLEIDEIKLPNTVWVNKANYVTNYNIWNWDAFEPLEYELYQDEIVKFIDDDDIEIYIRLGDAYYNYGRIIYENLDAILINSMDSNIYGNDFSNCFKLSKGLQYFKYEVVDNEVLVYINIDCFTYKEEVGALFNYPIVRYEIKNNELYSILPIDYDFVANDTTMQFDITYHKELKHKCMLESLDASTYVIEEVDYNYSSDLLFCNSHTGEVESFLSKNNQTRLFVYLMEENYANTNKNLYKLYIDCLVTIYNDGKMYDLYIPFFSSGYIFRPVVMYINTMIDDHTIEVTGSIELNNITAAYNNGREDEVDVFYQDYKYLDEFSLFEWTHLVSA